MNNPIVEKIKKLKNEKNAVILVHNYQTPEVQDIADYTGDSLGLSIKASKTDADVIVFCGVIFMAETAKIISPEKTVLLPDINAGCPMADMISAQQLRDLKDKHPNAEVLCYVNSTAEVKAESDICCTSGNAKTIIEKVLKDKEEIIFVPDKYLAYNMTRETGKKFIIWNGYCPTHVKILSEYVIKQKEAHPNAVVMVHPECNREVCELADAVLSTGQMLNYAKETNAKEIIVGTEVDMLYPLKKANPEKNFFPVTEYAVCPNMKKINIVKVLDSLENMEPEIIVDESIRKRAEKCIQRMLDIK